jgi:hypothetical protein
VTPSRPLLGESRGGESDGEQDSHVFQHSVADLSEKTARHGSRFDVTVLETLDKSSFPE